MRAASATWTSATFACTRYGIESTARIVSKADAGWFARLWPLVVSRRRFGAAWRRRAAAIMPPDTSRPRTERTRGASAAATRPMPQPRSSTSHSGPISPRRSSQATSSAVARAKTSASPNEYSATLASAARATAVSNMAATATTSAVPSWLTSASMARRFGSIPAWRRAAWRSAGQVSAHRGTSAPERSRRARATSAEIRPAAKAATGSSSSVTGAPGRAVR